MSDPFREPPGPVIHDPFLHAAPAAQKRRTPWLAVVAVTSTALLLAASATTVWLWRAQPTAADVSGGDPSGDVAPHPQDAPEPPPPVLPPFAPTALPSPPAAAPPIASGVPLQNQVTARGSITVVDLGVKNKRSLAEELALQRMEAQAKGQTLVLMMTRYGNKLLADFDAAIPDPLMQSALADVRLVRVDGRYFLVELEEMGVPTDSFPWFFLLGPDLTPRDGINGGEWDDDIARNIAPVLGPFVKGTYKTRRQVWTPPRSKGVQL